jgi:hypothetical protein
MTTEPTYILRTPRIHVVEEGKALDSGGTTVLEIADGGGGEFITIYQVLEGGGITTPVCINNESEWNAISAAVQDLFHEIAKNQPKESIVIKEGVIYHTTP